MKLKQVTDVDTKNLTHWTPNSNTGNATAVTKPYKKDNRRVHIQEKLEAK